MNIRDDFPILAEMVHDKPLVYLDNAATTQKPRAVIQAMNDYYEHANANVHRGVHALSVRATDAYEAAREKVRAFIGAAKVSECVFVRGTTEAINLVAESYVRPKLKAGDEILITHMEHHANIVPWQLLCQKTGAVLKVAPITAQGEVNLEAYEALLGPKTKFVSLSYVSNALGTINPVKTMIELAHKKGLAVLLDGAQATAHLPINVVDLDCDFYAFSGHKMYGPTGIGVLYGKQALLDAMPPYQGGGEMIHYVTFDETIFAPVPFKFEAGTPNIAGSIGLGAAIDYLSTLDMPVIEAYEADLLQYATEEISSLEGYRIIGTAKHKVPVISLVHDSIHPHDIGTILDTEGVAVRAGHHCAMPLMAYFQVPATVRLSMSFYNTREDIDVAVSALAKVIEVFR